MRRYIKEIMMKKIVLATLVMSAALVVNANENILYDQLAEKFEAEMSVKSTFESANTNSFLQIQTGIQNYKTIDDSVPFITGRFIATINDMYGGNFMAKDMFLKYSQHEVDYCVEKTIGYKNLAFIFGLGFLGSDAQKIDDSEIIKFQKSPYMLFGASVGQQLIEDIFVGLSLRLKSSLDRADMEQAIGIDSNMIWKNWSVGVGYEKISYNGFQDNDNVKLQVSYSMKF